MISTYTHVKSVFNLNGLSCFYIVLIPFTIINKKIQLNLIETNFVS